MDTKKSLIISLSSLAIIIVGFIGFNAYFTNIANPTDSPPSLSLITSEYKGSIVDKEFGFFRYTSDEISRISNDNLTSYKPASKGVNYFYTKQELTVEQVFNRVIKPDLDLKTLFVFYSNTTTKYNDKPCFLAYPEGPFAETCPIDATDIATMKLTPNTAYIIIASKDFEYNSLLTENSKNYSSSFGFNPPADESGWVLVPLALTNNFDNPRIKSIWLQSGQNAFEKVADISNINTNREFKMAWIYFGQGTQDQYTTR